MRKPEFRARLVACLVSCACVALHGEVLAVMFQPRQVLIDGIEFSATVTIGPETAGASSAGGCVYAANRRTGVVHRTCFNAAKQVTSSKRVINLNSASLSNNSADVDSLLGMAFDPDFHPAERIVLYLAYADSPAGPFDGKIARAVSTNGGESYTVDEEFITGLPRSTGNHQTNGLAFGPDRCLYIAQGSNSNAGYQWDRAESRLSGAILRACFKTHLGEIDPSFDRRCGCASNATSCTPNTQEACDVEVYAASPLDCG